MTTYLSTRPLPKTECPFWKNLRYWDSKFYTKTLRFLDSSLRRQVNVCPEMHLWFKPIETVPLEKVRWVLVADYPYPAPGYNDGYALSLQPHLTTDDLIQKYRLPYDYIRNNYMRNVSRNKPHSYSLSSWAQRGALLLTRVVTCDENFQRNHESRRMDRQGNVKGFTKTNWSPLITEIVMTVRKNKPETPFVFYSSMNHNYMKLNDGVSPALAISQTRQDNFFEWVDAHLDQPFDWKLQ